MSVSDSCTCSSRWTTTGDHATSCPDYGGRCLAVLDIDGPQQCRREQGHDGHHATDAGVQWTPPSKQLVGWVPRKNFTGDEWREAIEWALGLESDLANHTPKWAAEIIRLIREIGNRARPNDGRSGRCGIRLSGDAWCVLDVGHGGEHA